MKLGLCLEMAFTSEPFEERIRQASRIGFQWVEMWFTDLSYRKDPEGLAKLCRDCGVSMTNTVIGSPDGSIGGGLTDPGRRAEWLERARATLDFNTRAGIPATIVCTGNRIQGMSETEMMTSVMEGLEATVELAEEAGVNLLLEPLNDRYDHPGYWLTSSDNGAALCRSLSSPRLKLLFDCYHMQIMEGDLTRHIERNMDVIGHFHCAGVPGRNEPFKGEVDFPFLLDIIDGMGYQEVFALEYAPSIEDESSLCQTLKYFGSAMNPGVGSVGG